MPYSHHHHHVAKSKGAHQAACEDLSGQIVRNLRKPSMVCIKICMPLRVGLDFFVFWDLKFEKSQIIIKRLGAKREGKKGNKGGGERRV
jgi:hypothetical protein